MLTPDEMRAIAEAARHAAWFKDLANHHLEDGDCSEQYIWDCGYDAAILAMLDEQAADKARIAMLETALQHISQNPYCAVTTARAALADQPAKPYTGDPGCP